MTAHRASLRKRFIAIAAVLLTLCWWGVVAVVSRDVRPAAIELTETMFGGGMVLLYLATWAVACAVARNGRRMMLRAVVTTLVVVVLLLMLETAALFKLIDYSTYTRPLFDERSSPEAIFKEDWELSFVRPAHFYWSGQPRSDMARAFNLPVRAPRVQTFQTDANGFRNGRDLTAADIVLLGDSYVEGAYVSDDETVSAVLSHRLGRTVANLGRAGYGTLQQMVVFEKYGLPLKPRLVGWFFFEGNDLYDDQNYENAMIFYRGTEPGTKQPSRQQRPSRRVRTRREFRRASFVMNTLGAFRLWLHPIFPKTVPTFGWFTDEHDVVHRLYFYENYPKLTFGEFERERFETTKQTLQRGATLAAERGIRLVIFYIPMKFRVYGDFCKFPTHSPCLQWQPWRFSDEFMRFCRESGLDCVDLAPAMREAARGRKMLYAPEDSHWNKEGHEFVARELEKIWASRETAETRRAGEAGER